MTGKCKDCRYFCLNAAIYGDEDLRKWGHCKNPKLDIEGKGGLIRAGGAEDYGDYWHITGDFGCIFFEQRA